MTREEILNEMEIYEYLQNRSTPLAVIYVPKPSIHRYLAKAVSSYSPFLLPGVPFELLYLPEEYKGEEIKSLIYVDPIEDGYPSDLAYEETYGTIIISNDGDYPEISLTKVEKPKGNHRHSEDSSVDEKVIKKEKRRVFLLNILIIGLLVAGYFYGLPIALLVGAMVAMFIFDYLYLSRRKMAKKRDFKILESEFVEIFSYFSIFVKNGLPSYSALESVIPFSSPLMGEKIENLLADIDEDKTVMPFVKFGENFKSLEIKQVLIAIFKMGEEGGSEAYIRQFDTLFSALSANARRAGIDRKKSRLESMGFLPLVGSAIAMAIIMLAVSILLEGMGSYGF